MMPGTAPNETVPQMHPNASKSPPQIVFATFCNRTVRFWWYIFWLALRSLPSTRPPHLLLHRGFRSQIMHLLRLHFVQFLTSTHILISLILSYSLFISSVWHLSFGLLVATFCKSEVRLLGFFRMLYRYVKRTHDDMIPQRGTVHRCSQWTPGGPSTKVHTKGSAAESDMQGASKRCAETRAE